MRALALDETEAQAHASLGFVLFAYEWDWAYAEREIRRAMELDPNSHHWIYALYLRAAGRHEESLVQYRLAEERDPLSDVLKAQVAREYACAGRHDEAIALARDLHARVAATGRAGVVGDSAWLLNFVSQEYSLTGAHAKAIAAAERLVALTDSLQSGAMLAFVYARAGHRDEARALTDRLEAAARAAGRVWQPDYLYAALGDRDRAIAMFEREYTGRRDAIDAARCSITYTLLSEDPRVQAFLRRFGFPE